MREAASDGVRLRVVVFARLCEGVHIILRAHARRRDRESESSKRDLNRRVPVQFEFFVDVCKNILQARVYYICSILVGVHMFFCNSTGISIYF